LAAFDRALGGAFAVVDAAGFLVNHEAGVEKAPAPFDGTVDGRHGGLSLQENGILDLGTFGQLRA